MKYRFNTEQFKKDLEDAQKFIGGFFKSFGPSPKKVQGKKIGFFEEMHIRFRLSLVEMGISKLIRIGLVLIVGLITYFALFRNATSDWRWVIGYLFVFYIAWQFLPQIEKSRKDKNASFLEEFLFIIYDTTMSLIPVGKEEKKK